MALPPRGSGRPVTFVPPLAEIDDAMQTGLVIGELAFMNDESGFVLAFEHLRNDLVEGDDFGFNSGGEELQGQISSGQRCRERRYVLPLISLSEYARGATIIGP